MALIFTKNKPTGEPLPQWYNTVEGRFMNTHPSYTEMLTDIILSHARIDKSLSEIITELLIGTSKNSISEDITINILNEMSYRQKIEKLEGIKGLHLANGIKNIFKDLKKMGGIRNDLAHGDIVGMIRSDEFDKNFIIGLGEIDLLPKKEDTAKYKKIEKPFNTYSKLFCKYYGFFSADIKEQIKALFGGEHEYNSRLSD